MIYGYESGDVALTIVLFSAITYAIIKFVPFAYDKYEKKQKKLYNSIYGPIIDLKNSIDEMTLAINTQGGQITDQMNEIEESFNHTVNSNIDKMIDQIDQAKSYYKKRMAIKALVKIIEKNPDIISKLDKHIGNAINNFKKWFKLGKKVNDVGQKVVTKVIKLAESDSENDNDNNDVESDTDNFFSKKIFDVKKKKSKSKNKSNKSNKNFYEDLITEIGKKSAKDTDIDSIKKGINSIENNIEEFIGKSEPNNKEKKYDTDDTVSISGGESDSDSDASIICGPAEYKKKLDGKVDGKINLQI